MKRRVLVIGIGAGHPDHVTVQAVHALNEASVFFLPEKGGDKQDLARLRRDICERHVRGQDYRMVPFDVPERGMPRRDYTRGIEDWRTEVARVYERLLEQELGEGDIGAFLVWGDPSLYDGTLRILDWIRAKGRIELEYEVIPGITSVQALAASHKVALNRTGGPVTITTGRRLAAGLPDDDGNVVVMLDSAMAFKSLEPGGLHIYWGAYVGTPDEVLVSGRLDEVAPEIERARKAARDAHGWIMDTYLLTRPGEPGDKPEKKKE